MNGPACCTPSLQPAPRPPMNRRATVEILGPEENPGEADEMEHHHRRDDPRRRPAVVGRSSG